MGNWMSAVKVILAIALWGLIVPTWFTPIVSAPTASPIIFPTSYPTSSPSAQPSLYLPRLLNFDFDSSVGNITLFFDHLMEVKSFNYSKIQLQAYADIDNNPNPNSTVTMKLSGVYNNLMKQGNSTRAVIMMNAFDYAVLRMQPLLGNSSGHLFMSIEEGSIRSAYGADVQAISEHAAIMCRVFKHDVLPPFLSSYRINMNLGRLELTFSEPINITTFTIDGLALQRIRNAKVTSAETNQYYEFFVDTDTEVLEVSNYQRTVEVSVGFQNMNAIKRAIGLAVTRETTFLSAWRPFVKDLAGNDISLVAFDKLNGVPPAEFQGDYTSPYLMHWDYDANQATISLYFSETIYYQFFNFSGIQLSNGTHPFLRVHNPVNMTPHHDFDIIRFTLADEQRFYLESLGNVFTEPSNTYIILDQGIVVDTAYTQNLYSSNLATDLHPMAVRRFQYDHVRPRLVFCKLDLKHGFMLLRFSKSIKLSSLKMKYLSLQSAENQVVDTEVFHFHWEDIELLTTENSIILEFSLKPHALAKLRTFSYLGKSTEYTYVVALRPMLVDTAFLANELVDVPTDRGLQVSHLIPDETDPVLVDWSINLSTDLLVFNFSKPVELDTLQLSEATLSSDDRMIRTTQSFSLSMSELLSEGSKATSIVVRLSASDVMTIKSSRGFCNVESTCFLSINPDFVKSLRNISESVNNRRRKDYDKIIPRWFVAPTVFVPDLIPPKVTHFSLDLDQLLLNLEFSKPVIIENANLSQFILSFSPSLSWNGDQTAIESTGGQPNATSLNEFCIAEGVVNTTMSIWLTPRVLQNIQMLRLLGLSVKKTFLYFGSSAIADLSGNFLKPVIKQANHVYADHQRPELVGIYLHPSLNNISVYMSEVVNVSSLDVSSFRLVSLSGYQTDLSGCGLVLPDYRHSSITSFFTINLEPIRAKLTSYKIATSQATSILYIAGNKLPVDSSPSANRALAGSSASAVSDGVEFTAFHLNMNEGFILLEMSFYVELVSFSPSSFIFRASDFSASYGLSSIDSFEMLESGPGLKIYLSDQDKSRIQQYIPLDSKEKLRLLVLSTAVTDKNKKKLSKTVNLPCSYLMNDRSPPFLKSYILNLEQGNIVLTFSKEIVIDSLDLDGTMELVDSITNTTQQYVVRNLPRAKSGYLTKEVILDLNVGYPVTEREQILLKFPLGINVNHTYLTMQRGIAYDNSFPPNPCDPIYIEDALQPEGSYYDSSGPSLIGFDLQLSDRVLLLNFSEAIDATSLRMNKFTLANSRDISTATFYRLTTSSKAMDDGPSSYVKVQLSDYDMNRMMYVAPRLIMSAATSFISVELFAFKDLAKKDATGSGNDNNPVYFRYGLPVTRYFEDYVPPRLVSYNISIPEGILDMEFSEIVNCDTLLTEGIRFQPYQFLGRRPKRKVNLDGSRFSSTYLDDEESYTVSLSNESYCEVENKQNFDTNLKVVISYQDMVRIKSTFMVLKAANTTFMTMKENTIRDTFGNGNEAISDADAMAVTSFIPDTTSPKLLAFSLTSTQLMTLYFNEPVDYRSLDLTKIFFQDGKVGHKHNGYHLQKAKLYGTDIYKMILEVELLYDFFRMQTSSSLFKSQYHTNIHVPSATIRDLSKNSLVEIPQNYALTVGPSLIFWDLNLDDGYLLLEFSEMVHTNFSLQGFTLQNVQNYSVHVVDENACGFIFTTESIYAEYLGNRLYQMELSAADLYSLKMSSILTITHTPLVGPRSALYRHYPLYLTMDRNLTTSSAPEAFLGGMENLAILSTDALPVRYFIPDVSPPICSMFDLDLNSGTLLLYFNEPLDLTTLKLTGLTLFSTTEGNFATLSKSYDITYNASDPYETRSLVQRSNQKNVEITLSLQDLNTIKLAILRSNDTALDGLVITSNALFDISGNGIIGNDPDHPIYINDFVADTTPPTLVSYQIDESNYFFKLLFDEVVNPEDLFPTDVTLMNTASNLSYPNISTSYQLTNFTLVNQTDVTALVPYQYAKRTVLLDLGFLRFDEFQIESRHIVLQRNLSRSFLYLPKMKDIFGNEITSAIIKQVDSFVANTRKVVLESFDFDDSDVVNYKSLTLYFSRAMDVSTLDCSEFTLSVSPSASATDVVNPTASDCVIRTKTNQRVVVVDIDSSLFSSSSIGSAVSSTYLYTASSMTDSLDIYGNTIEVISTSSALQVGPQIVKVSIDLNRGELLMVFSKEILLSSAFSNASTIGFYSSATKSKVYLDSDYDVNSFTNIATEYQLVTSNSARLNDSVLSLSLTAIDLSRVKLLDVKQGSFFFLLESGSCTDVNNVANVEKKISSKFFITRIIPDLTVPTIVNVTINVGSEQMTIEFDEPILKSSFRVNNIRIQSHVNVDIETNDEFIYTNTSTQFLGVTRVSYRLTGGTVTQSLNTLTIVFSPSDANSLKLNPYIAKNISNTFISLEYQTATDMAGNYLESIPFTNAREIDSFITDTSRPELLAFTLDLNRQDRSNHLTLKFSEPMSVSTLNITDITVQSRFAQRDGVYYRLTGGILLTSDSDTIIIELLAEDVLNMKLIPGLIRRKQSTYLIYSENMAMDLFGNKVLPEVDGYAFGCTTFIADKIAPRIIHAKIDMTDESITFSMDEPVVLATIDVTKLSVQSKPGEIFAAAQEDTTTVHSEGDHQEQEVDKVPFIRYTLSNQSAVLVTSTLSATFTIQLAPQDIDSLKSLYPMTKDIHTTWFQINQKFLFDFVGNSIENVYPRDPYRADEFVEDEIRPEVVKYSLDMNAEEIRLVYSEAVFTETLNLSEIIVQSAAARRFGYFTTLTNCSFSVGNLGLSKRIQIHIDHDSMLFLKYYGIGADEGTSFISFSDVSSLDYRRNRLMPAWDGSVVGSSPKSPDHLQVDTTSPRLLRWYIDRSNLLSESSEGEMVMYFNEPVVIRHPSRILLTSSASKSPNHPLWPTNLENEAIRRTRYFQKNTEVRMTLKDYCLDKHSAFISGERCKNSFFSFLSMMKSDEQSRYGLLIGNHSIVDFAKTPNSIETISLKFFMMFEDGPDCNECSDGYYVQTNCTSNSDRVCLPCTRCKDQHYELLSCESYRDRSCAPCTKCRYGEFISTECSSERDTVCEACTRCPAMTYPERECALGLDSICNSCEQCVFGSARAQEFCQRFPSYLRWKNANCCYDRNNNMVPCKDKLHNKKNRSS